MKLGRFLSFTGKCDVESVASECSKNFGIRAGDAEYFRMQKEDNFCWNDVIELQRQNEILKVKSERMYDALVSLQEEVEKSTVNVVSGEMEHEMKELKRKNEELLARLKRANRFKKETAITLEEVKKQFEDLTTEVLINDISSATPPQGRPSHRGSSSSSSAHLRRDRYSAPKKSTKKVSTNLERVVGRFSEPRVLQQLEQLSVSDVLQRFDDAFGIP